MRKKWVSEKGKYVAVAPKEFPLTGRPSNNPSGTEKTHPKYEYRVVPNSWRNLVTVRHQLKSRFRRQSLDPMFIDLLKGKTVFITDEDAFQPDIKTDTRRRKLAKLYHFAARNYRKLHTHIYYDTEKNEYGLLAWMTIPTNAEILGKPSSLLEEEWIKRIP